MTTTTVLPVWEDPAEVPAEVRADMEDILASDHPIWGGRAKALQNALYGQPPAPDAMGYQDCMDLLQASAQILMETPCEMGCGRNLHISEKDAAGLGLCGECLAQAEMENEHSDGYHDDDPDPTCIDCTQERQARDAGL
jgi:hypothetical protein